MSDEREPRARGHEDEIRALIDARVRAVSAKDVQAAMAPVSSAIVEFDVVGPLQRAGSAELVSRAEAWFSSFDGPIGFEMRDVVIAAGSDTAYSHSLNGYSGTKTDGTPLRMWVRMTTCYRRIEGRWVVTHEHTSVPFDVETGKASLGLSP